MWQNYTRLHGTILKKTVIFVVVDTSPRRLVTVRTISIRLNNSWMDTRPAQQTVFKDTRSLTSAVPFRYPLGQQHEPFFLVEFNNVS